MSTSNGGLAGPAPVCPSPASRPWSAGVWVLGALAAGAVLFVSGLVTGFLLGGAGDGTTTTAPQPGPAPEAGSAVGPAPQPGAVDECLVGSWRTVEHEESFSTPQGPVTITGLVRQMDVDEGGRQTITYDAASADMGTSGSQGTAVYDGTVVYQVATSGGTMSFELLSSEGTITLTPADGEPRTQDLQPGTGPVRYTCEDSRLTQEADGFRAVYERSR